VRKGIVSALLVGAVLIAAIAAVSAQTRSRSAGQNPFVGANLFVGNQTEAALAVKRLRAHGRRKDARLLAKIARQSWASWFLESDLPRQPYWDVKARVDQVTAAGGLPVLVAYDIPHRDCGSYSAGGAKSARAYERWVREFAQGIGNRKAVVILEPDALAELDCHTPRIRAETLRLMRFAVDTLTTSPNLAVYVDAGNESWASPAVLARRLTQVHIGRARGFALNVSNFYRVQSERLYGDRISALVGGKPFVVDTSRDGRGPAPGAAWCNPPGRGLGPPFATNTGDPHIDALLWIKAPGESDGTCRGGPNAGEWWLPYALGLARRSAF
jgi:endoglucanase